MCSPSCLKDSENLTSLLSEGIVHLQHYWDKCAFIRYFVSRVFIQASETRISSPKKADHTIFKKELKDMQSQNRMFRI